jgi:N-methylhydantoinase A
MTYRIGIDSGGTFTDAVLFDEQTGALHITKTPSTPYDPSLGVFEAIQKIIRLSGLPPLEVSALIHGTTVATNALLEYKGVRTAVILTEHFKDILSIVRQDRPKMYDFFKRRPEPLVPRHLRFEVRERMLYDGRVLVPLDQDQVRSIIARLKRDGIMAVAVCLLHSYANPAHEIRIKELFDVHYPEASVSLSWDVLPEIREYERMSTTIINAYVMPIIERYLRELEGRLDHSRLTVDLNVMQSNGGIMPSRSASKKSVATILSGPAGGVIGSHFLAGLARVRDLITLDIGGTSTDICLIAGGRYLTTKESEIGGHAIKVPMIDINTIGAGGGSIAWIDRGGALRVGPQSAGAAPGPACYGQGGREPTVTDANLVLGRLNPEYYVGGEMTLHPELSREIILEKIALPLGLTLDTAAEGILKVVNANMIRGIRRVSVERGYDPRHFSMIAFGGGGPVHAADLAVEMNLPRVMVPLTPGVNSALGLLIADFRYDFSKTFLTRVAATTAQNIERNMEELEQRALKEMLREGIPRDRILFIRTVDMRYLGQGYEIEVPFGGGAPDLAGIDRLLENFHGLHERLYGYRQPEAETEIVYLRLAALGHTAKPGFPATPAAGPDASGALKGQRPVFIQGRFIDTRLYERRRLKPGNRAEGPAVIEQFDSTTLVLPGQLFEIDEFMNILIHIAGR